MDNNFKIFPVCYLWFSFLHWHMSKYQILLLQVQTGQALERRYHNVMNTSEDTSTISCNAFSPARSTLGKNKIKCMTSNDVWDNLDLQKCQQKLIREDRFLVQSLQKLLLSSADHLYLTHERSFDNKTYLQQIEKIVTETGIRRYWQSTTRFFGPPALNYLLFLCLYMYFLLRCIQYLASAIKWDGKRWFSTTK